MNGAARSYLFVPGDNERLLAKAPGAGADIVIIDLEDGVPPDRKDLARTRTAERIGEISAWVRVNAPGSDACARDLEAVAEHAAGIRLPKVDDPAQAAWVAERAPGRPLICGIESARGLLAARETAAVDAVEALALGGIDLLRELDFADGPDVLGHVRFTLAVASSAAGIAPPVDRVFGRLDDDAGLRADAEAARRLGFGGKSAIHPRQLEAIHETFTPSAQALARAREVMAAFERSGGAPTTLADGEFVDLPVALRAQRTLARAGEGS